METRRFIAAAVALLLTGGCTSTTPIRLTSPGEPPFGSVAAGDTVIVRTRSDEQIRFVVQKIDGTTLVDTTGRRYDRSDMLSLERKAVSGPKTTALVAGIAGGVVVIVMFAVGNWLAENSQ
jgi:hypothetical protein